MRRRGLLERRIVPGASLIVLGLGLCLKGANSAFLAALLSMALLALLLVALLFAERRLLGAAIKTNAISLGAALVLLAWACLTAAPMCGPWSHPAWREFGLSTCAISLSPSRTLEGVVALIGAIAAFGLGNLAIEAEEDRDWIGALIVPLAFAFALLGLWAHINDPSADGRLRVFFRSANSAAVSYGVLLVFLIAFVLRKSRRDKDRRATGANPWRRYLGWVVATPFANASILLCAACLFLTASRAGIASTLAGLLVLIAFTISRFRSAGRLSLVLIVLMAFFGVQFALARLGSFELDARSREAMISTHWRAFLERPLIGHGMNTFHEINALRATPEAWTALGNAGAAHNIYVQMLEENGLVGAVLFLALLAPPLVRSAFEALGRRGGAIWRAGAFSAFVVALMQGFVDFGLQTPALAALLSFYLGAATSSGAAPPRDGAVKVR